MVNQPLSPRELVTFANQILARDSSMPGSPSVDDLTMGKHVQWLGLPAYPTYSMVITRVKEIIAYGEVIGIIEERNRYPQRSFYL